MDETAQTKTCTKCGQDKQLDQFHASKTGRLGRRSDCRECKNARDFAKWERARDARRERVTVARREASGGATKQCSDCGEAKPVLEFYALDSSPDGRHRRCRVCFVSNRRKRRAMTADERAAEAAEVAVKPTKVCGTCGLEKPRERFRSRKASRDGMSPKCRDCEREWQREHYAQIRERRLEQSRAWYESNRARKAETAKLWLKNNPERVSEYNHRRRARVYGTRTGHVDPDALWTGFCALCLAEMDRGLSWPDPMSPSLDHVVPLSRGGTHEQSNLQWAHLRCNIAKGARLPDPSEEVA